MRDRKVWFSSGQATSLAALAVGVALVASACGGGSGGSRGSGGSTGTATGGTGSGTGGGSGTGTGGNTGSGFPCNAVTVSSPYITDFSDWTGSKWGKDNLKGGVFTYMGTGSTISAVGDTTSLKVMGTVMNYAGFGMYFDGCVNAAAYTGVQFTIGGDLGMCTLELQVQTNSTKAPETSSMKGSCTTPPCTSGAAKMLMVTPGTPVVVKWADLMGAAPGPFSAADMVALQWQLTTAMSCMPNFTVDDIKFVQ